MDDDSKALLREALPWNGEPVVDFYVKAHPSFPFREQFVQLLFEAYHAYLARCPRASIIVAGEALLRAVYDRIVELSTQGKITLPKGKRTPLNLEGVAQLYKLADVLSYCQALEVLKKSGVYPQDLVDQLFVIKDLRNCAAHGDLPLLDYWDPDDPRPEGIFAQLLRGEIEIPEGYRFWLKNRRNWFAFDCREHKCGSLRHLSPEDRLAAIQYLLVVNAISKL